MWQTVLCLRAGKISKDGITGWVINRLSHFFLRYCAAFSIAWPPAEMSAPIPCTVWQPVRANKEISAVAM